MADDMSLRDELSKAFDDPANSIPSAAPAPEPVAAPSAPAPAPAAPQADGQAAEPSLAPAEGSKPRDEHGRFAKPGETAQNPTAEKPLDAGAKAQLEPIQPPASWSAAAKAMWATLPAPIQSEVAKREADVARGFNDRAAQLKRYEPLEQVIAPHRERLALAGIDEGTYVRSLVTADEMLRGPNRVQALQHIAQSYGINLQSLAQAPGQPQGAQVDPAVQQLQTDIASLKSELQRRSQAEAGAQTSQLQDVIERFATNPANLYFENVRGHVAALLQSGVVNGATWDEMLQNAYDQAVWANPETRQALSVQQAEKQRQAETEAARAKAQQARAASGSVVGSPSPGSGPAQDAAPSLRAELERQFAAQ